MLIQDDIDNGLSPDRWGRMLRTFIQNAFSFHRQSIFDVLAHQYSDWERPMSAVGRDGGVRDNAAARDSIVDMLGDGQVLL